MVFPVSPVKLVNPESMEKMEFLAKMDVQVLKEHLGLLGQWASEVSPDRSVMPVLTAATVNMVSMVSEVQPVFPENREKTEKMVRKGNQEMQVSWARLALTG